MRDSSGGNMPLEETDAGETNPVGLGEIIRGGGVLDQGGRVRKSQEDGRSEHRLIRFHSGVVDASKVTRYGSVVRGNISALLHLGGLSMALTQLRYSL